MIHWWKTKLEEKGGIVISRISLAIRMLQLLRSHSIMKKSELALHLDVSERYVLYLKEELEAAGYLIHAKNGKHGGYELDKSSLLVVSELTKKEQECLTSLLGYVEANETILKKKEYVHLLSKLSSGYTNASIPKFAVMQGFPLLCSLNRLEEYFSKIQFAMSQGNIVELTYKKSNGKESVYQFEPYQFAQYKNGWYVIGLVREEQRTFKLNRIISLRISTTKFQRKDTFCIKKTIHDDSFNFASMSIELKIMNRPDVAEYCYGDNQKITYFNDKEFILAVDMKGDYIIRSFVLGLGSSCEVLRPEELKEFVKEEWREMQQYWEV